MTENPYSAPTAPLIDPSSSDRDLSEVARAQRMLLLSVVASLAGNAVMRTAALGILLIPVMLAVTVFSIWCVHRLCRALGTRPLGWILAMFIPLLNLICLVILNQRATALLKANGISVGLMGAKI